MMNLHFPVDLQYSGRPLNVRLPSETVKEILWHALSHTFLALEFG